MESEVPRDGLQRRSASSGRAISLSRLLSPARQRDPSRFGLPLEARSTNLAKKSLRRAMISATEDEAIKLRREFVELHRGARLGQLFAWLGVLGEDQFDKSIWDIEDEQMVEIISLHREEPASSRSNSQQLV